MKATASLALATLLVGLVVAALHRAGRGPSPGKEGPLTRPPVTSPALSSSNLRSTMTLDAPELEPRRSGVQDPAASTSPSESSEELEPTGPPDEAQEDEDFDVEFTPEELELFRLRSDNESLRLQLDRKNLEILRLTHPEDDPYSVFLHSDEAAPMSRGDLLSIEDLLHTFPVFLQPGEATEIIELEHGDAWRNLAPISRVFHEMYIRVLGPQRILREVPREEIPKIRERLMDDDLWNAYFAPYIAAEEGGN